MLRLPRLRALQTNPLQQSIGGPRRYFRKLAAEHLEERTVLATQTTGLFLNTPQAFEGYTLFSPQQAKTTYLINNEGTVINSWQSQFRPGLLSILREDGTLLRAGVGGPNPNISAPGSGGHLEIFSWEGDLLWSFDYNTPQHLQHHDIEALPNGNILILGWDYKTEDEATAAGRDPDLPGPGWLFPDTVVELRPNLEAGTGADIVWKWSVWDHLVQDQFPAKDNYASDGVTAHPDLVDVNYVNTTIGTGTASAPADFTHANGIDYNPELDLIVISVREYNEFWVIDHSTTTDEAAGNTGGRSGQGGDILWRWGNPEAYGRGGPEDRKFFWQHDANWVVDGVNGNVDNIMVFNNGWGRGPSHDINLSSADEVRPPLTVSVVGGVTEYQFDQPPADEPFGPSELTSTYVAEAALFSPIISGARRLPNGNTLMTFGIHGTMVEVNPAGQIVWKYVNPVTAAGPLARNEPIPFNSPGAPGVFGLIKANFFFKAIRYAPDFPGFAGKDLVPRFRTTIGLYDPSTFTWYLNQELGGSVENLEVFTTPPVPSSWVPLAGDWNGDGKDSIGLWDPENFRWYLNNDVDGTIDDMIVFTTPPVPRSWIPVTGDWNGDGLDTVGLYNPATRRWFLNNQTDNWLPGDLINFRTVIGNSKWKPLAGDWDGDGSDTVGLYNPGASGWHLYATLDGSSEGKILFRTPLVPRSWIPLVGDWNDDGLDTVGLYDPFTNTWYTNDETDGTIDSVRAFRTPTVPNWWRPITGNWDGSGIFDGGTAATTTTASQLTATAAPPPANSITAATDVGSTKQQDPSSIDAALLMLVGSDDESNMWSTRRNIRVKGK
jgi:hypothetical protein